MDLKSALLILLFFAAVIVATIWLARIFLLRRARRVGNDSVLAYLRAIPGSDVQKLDAVDLALKGGVITILGVIFPPLIVVGLVPLYYGARKITMTLMGLGLTDNAST
jgi:hypothetical protein